MPLFAAALLLLGVICVATGVFLPEGSPKARLVSLAGYICLPLAILAAGLS